MRFGELTAILICATLLAVLAATQLAPSAPAAVAEPVLPVADLQVVETWGPVNYFVDSCARCHGAPETAYLSFKKNLRGEPLKEQIRLMANGPAAAPIEEHYVQQQHDLHNAMAEQRPYVWIDPEQTEVIAGEVIPGTTVRAGGVQANIRGHWFVLPKTDAPIIATRERRTVTIKLQTK